MYTVAMSYRLITIIVLSRLLSHGLLLPYTIVTLYYCYPIGYVYRVGYISRRISRYLALYYALYCSPYSRTNPHPLSLLLLPVTLPLATDADNTPPQLQPVPPSGSGDDDDDRYARRSYLR